MKGILFKEPMIQAIMEGRKTQTRRLGGLEDMNRLVDYAGAANSPDMYSLMGFDGKVADFYRYAVTVESVNVGVVYKAKPRFRPGETVYVKEAIHRFNRTMASYTLDYTPVMYRGTAGRFEWRWKKDYLSSLHLPEDAARTHLLILTVEPQRLQDITEEDAIGEGIVQITANLDVFHWDPQIDKYKVHGFGTAKIAYAALWDSINPKLRWEVNPWVWRIEFQKVERV